MRVSRLLLVVLATVLAVTSCSSADAGGAGSASATASTAASTGSVPSADATTTGPVTVEHRYGSTTVGQRPARVVTLEPQWTDTMLALGVTPVGAAIDTLMPDSRTPWQDLPAGTTTLEVGQVVPFEQIAALQPDLIVGSFTIGDQATYDRLSAIAPTVASLTDRQVDTWQDMTTTAGTLLREPAAAAALIGKVDDQVQQVATELPGLKGKSFLLGQYLVGTGLVLVADPDDGSSRFFTALGMQMYEPVAAEGKSSGAPRIQVSTERSDLLRADLVAFLVNGGDKSALADIPGFDTLPGTVDVLDYPTIVGLNVPSPLSIPYALQQLRPALEKVAA